MEFLEITNVSISFGRNIVIDNFNHKFHPGVTFVTGKNGVGKSTLLSIISTIKKPDIGEVICSIRNIKKPFNIIENGIFVPDKPDFYNFMTVKEFFNLMKKIKKLSFNLNETVLFDEFNLSNHLYTPLHALSFGTKKKIFLLVALAISPPVIIFDEPTNGLDSDSYRVLIEHIKINCHAGNIIIISSHDEEFTSHFNAATITL